MNIKIFSRLLILFLISVVSVNCSSSDDGDSDLTISNKEKIIGVWYKSDQCEEQNNYMFSADLGYERLNSGNMDCNNNEYSTYKYTGNYNIVENELFFNQQTSEVFIEGNTLSVTDFELSSTKHTIEVLNDTNLTIKTTVTSDSGTNIYSNSFER